jgi:HK97 family phage major capsid protein
MDITEFKGLLDKQGEAFEAFKATHDELKKNDTLTAEKLARIEKSLDDAVEAKARIEAAVKAEAKEREELEAKFNRHGLSGTKENAQRALELKEFNATAKSAAVARQQSFTPIDEKGYDEYKGAFNRWMIDGDRALTDAEFKTLSVGSAPDGGYFVTPDVTGRIVKKVFETSPIRQYASVQAITTDALEGIEDTGEAGAGYAGEHGTSGDTTTPQVGKWRIPVWWIDTEPKATQQLLDDAAVDIEAWLAGKVGEKLGRFENAEFVAGNANKIRGLVSYTTAADSGAGVAWGTIGHVVTGVNGDFAASAKGDKLYDLMGTLKDEYLAGAAWFTRRSVVTAIRKFKDGQNNYLWQPSFIAGQPETIMGYPVARMDDMPALATDSLSLAFGNLAAAYQVVDRMGVRVIRDNLTSKPYVKFYTAKRTGGAVVNFEAIKFLKFGT